MSGLSDKDIAILDEFIGENYAEDGPWINSYVYLPNKALSTAGTWSFGDLSISGILSPKSILSVQY